jgi:hypothetical protein
LLLIEMFTERSEVYVIDTPGKTRQKVGETKDRTFSCVEGALVSS